jgi:hypothetical protein
MSCRRRPIHPADYRGNSVKILTSLHITPLHFEISLDFLSFNNYYRN